MYEHENVVQSKKKKHAFASSPFFIRDASYCSMGLCGIMRPKTVFFRLLYVLLCAANVRVHEQPGFVVIVCTLLIVMWNDQSDGTLKLWCRWICISPTRTVNTPHCVERNFHMVNFTALDWWTVVATSRHLAGIFWVGIRQTFRPDGLDGHQVPSKIKFFATKRMAHIPRAFQRMYRL